jgi:hypothetical protein
VDNYRDFKAEARFHKAHFVLAEGDSSECLQPGSFLQLTARYCATAAVDPTTAASRTAASRTAIIGRDFFRGDGLQPGEFTDCGGKWNFTLDTPEDYPLSQVCPDLWCLFFGSHGCTVKGLCLLPKDLAKRQFIALVFLRVLGGSPSHLGVL